MEGLVVGGRYHVLRAIGHGGMGTVYDAIHAKTGRRVALKLIHERLVSSEGGRRRFEREARTAASIDSLHVVQILDSGDDEASGMPFIVMEHLQGEDLRALLKRGPLPERLAISIALQIAIGLKKAHENEIVHRDLKPGNVFIAKMDDRRRVVKLLDFGIAKLVDGESATTDLTATTDTVGSPPYMSPEQLKSPRDVDGQSDVWALGVVLYEMLAGSTPTSGVETIGARVYAICHAPAPALRERAPHVSSQLAAVVHRALEIDKAKRFPSADAMITALRSVSPGAGDVDILEEDLVFLAEARPAVVVPAHVFVQARRSRWGLVAGGAGLLAVVGIAGAAASRARAPEVERPSPSVAADAPPPPTASAIPVQVVSALPSSSMPAPPTATATAKTEPKRLPSAKSAKTPSPRPTATTGDGREEL